MFLPTLARSPELSLFHSKQHARDALHLLRLYRSARLRGDTVGAKVFLTLAKRYLTIAKEGF